MLKLFNDTSNIEVFHVGINIFSVPVEVSKSVEKLILVHWVLEMLAAHVLQQQCAQMLLQPGRDLVHLVV